MSAKLLSLSFAELLSVSFDTVLLPFAPQTYERARQATTRSVCDSSKCKPTTVSIEFVCGEKKRQIIAKAQASESEKEGSGIMEIIQ